MCHRVPLSKRSCRWCAGVSLHRWARLPRPRADQGPRTAHYIFQLFALSSSPDRLLYETASDRARPRDVLASIAAPVVARGCLTGVYER